MRGRVDTEAFKQGVANLINMIPDPRGPARRRGGSRNIHEHNDDTWVDARIETMQVNYNLFYSLIFGDQVCYINTPDVSVPSGNIVNEPVFYGGVGSTWTESTTGNADVIWESTGKVILRARAAGAAAYINQNLGSISGTRRVIVCTEGDAPYRIKVGHSSGAGDHYDAVHHERTVILDVNFAGAGSEHVSVHNLYSDGDGEGVNDVAVYSVYVFNNVSSNNVTKLTTPYGPDELRELYFITAPSGNEMYVLHPNHQPRKITYTESTDSWAIAAVTFTAPPASWTGSEWPSCGCFFQGRLWLSGHPAAPETFWGSKSGNYEDFTTGATAADSLEFTMVERGAIQWMAGLKNLLIGTENGEHIVDSEAGVIYGGDISVNRQSSYGSYLVRAEQVGDQLFYVSPDRLKIRGMQYEWTANNWLSRDLTFYSEHITDGLIREVCWAQNPDNLFYCVLDDGTLALMAYERGNNIYGWSTFDTDGIILSAAVGSRGGDSLLMAAVNRDGAYSACCVEHIHCDYYMDGYIEVYDDSETATSIDGLDHLEGQTVQVTIDNATHPDKVVASGQISLDYTGKHIVAGLKYESTLKTLTANAMGAQIGSSVPFIKRFNKIYVTLLESAYPLINGERPPTISGSTTMDETEPDSTETIQVLSEGWDYNAHIEIIQDIPRALTVVGISGELNQEL